MKTPSNEQVREAFRVLAESETFAGSDRLVGFLDYVVTEKLEGRGELIRGKSIAMDVYGYEPDEVERRESVVRVDAGRVRRKLQEYYRTEGEAAPLRIGLPKGGYVPVFEPAPQPSQPKSVSQIFGTPISAMSKLLLLSGAMFAIVFLAWTFWPSSPVRVMSGPQDDIKQEEAENTRRTVLFDTAPERLQAMNLAKQGRSLIFPATDQERLQAAMLVFERAIKLDASYAGAYAGAAQVAGSMALTTSEPDRVRTLLKQTQDLAGKSVQLAPDLSWAVSALAWANFASGDHEAALIWSNKAKEMSPDDPNILEFDALISLYGGQFERVIEDTTKLSETANAALPFVFQNASSAAYFHLGEYERCIAGFEAAIAAGAPLGPITVAYLMAAYHSLGDRKRALELAQKFNSTWPGERVDLMAERWYKETAHSAQLTDGMRAAGWQPD